MKHNLEETLVKEMESIGVETFYVLNTDIQGEIGSDMMEVTLKVVTNRQTGKSFRTKMKALLEASSGKKVSVVLRDIPTARSVFSDCVNICGKFIDDINVSSGSLFVGFPNGGFITFRSVSQATNRGYDIILEDY